MKCGCEDAGGRRSNDERRAWRERQGEPRAGRHAARPERSDTAGDATTTDGPGGDHATVRRSRSAADQTERVPDPGREPAERAATTVKGHRQPAPGDAGAK